MGKMKVKMFIYIELHHDRYIILSLKISIRDHKWTSAENITKKCSMSLHDIPPKNKISNPPTALSDTIDHI